MKKSQVSVAGLIAVGIFCFSSCGQKNQFGSQGSIKLPGGPKEIPNKGTTDQTTANPPQTSHPSADEPAPNQPSPGDLPDTPKTDVDPERPLGPVSPPPPSPLPVASLSGVPSGESNLGALNVIVGGNLVSSYEFAVIGGAADCASATRTRSLVAEPIKTDLSGFSEGPLKICAWGIDSLERKQIAATEASWTKKYLACGSVASGATTSRLTYVAASVPFGSSCQQVSQTGSCFNGNLTWSGTLIPSCGVQAPGSCVGTGGVSIAHNNSESRVRYQSATVAFGGSCVSGNQTRTCNNGTFGAWTGSSYANTSCSEAAPASCTGVNGAQIAHGLNETRTVYQASSVPFGSSCASGNQTRQCNNGSWLAWTGSSYTQSSCTVAARTCPSNGRAVDSFCAVASNYAGSCSGVCPAGWSFYNGGVTDNQCIHAINVLGLPGATPFGNAGFGGNPGSNGLGCFRGNLTSVWVPNANSNNLVFNSPTSYIGTNAANSVRACFCQ